LKTGLPNSEFFFFQFLYSVGKSLKIGRRFVCISGYVVIAAALTLGDCFFFLDSEIISLTNVTKAQAKTPWLEYLLVG